MQHSKNCGRGRLRWRRTFFNSLPKFLSSLQFLPVQEKIKKALGDHAIVKALADTTDEARIANVSEVLLDQALLVSGAELKDPMEFVKAMNALLA